MSSSYQNKLSEFVGWLSQYLYAYRKHYQIGDSDPVRLRFLVNGSPDTVIIIGCPNEDLGINVGEFWFNGSILRRCISREGRPGTSFSMGYVDVTRYEDQFATTLVSLNPDIPLGQAPTTPPNPNPVPGDQDYLRRSGDRMLGPLLLQGDPTDYQEAVPKIYVDNLHKTLQTQLNNLASDQASARRQLGLALADLNALKVQLSEFIQNIGYKHVQGTESSRWVIQHNRASIFLASFVVKDEQGEVFVPAGVQIINENTVAIDFNSEASGTATLMFI